MNDKSIYVGDNYLGFDLPTPEYDERDTTDFMDYTCPTVDGAFETLETEVVDLLAHLTTNVNDRLDQCLDTLQKNPRSNVTHAVKRLLLLVANEAIKREVESVETDTIDFIADCNSTIKNDVTLPWRQASVDMMNSAFESGAEQMWDEVESVIDGTYFESGIDPETAYEDAVAAFERMQKQFEEYQYWVDYNRDMGFASPESVGKMAHFADIKNPKSGKLVQMDMLEHFKKELTF